MKKNILLIFICISIAACGQEQQSREAVTNVLTENHSEVKGTKVSLIPPAGFSEATNFNGYLQSESNS